VINQILLGDNLEIMKALPDGCIDLIYIDPPFFTQQNFKTFTDKYKSIYDYLNWLIIRIKEMHRLLKETGSIYVHLDWHSVHYVKVEMDKIFGYDNFINEIIWRYRRMTPAGTHFQRTHDTILRYAKGKKVVWNQLYEERALSTLKAFGNKKVKTYWTKAGKKFVRATEEISPGTRMSDVWEIPIAGSASYERDQGNHFPTQKPEKLLERIILASSNLGDLVADFFCGSGTALAVAKKLGRNYFGCDVSEEAVKIAKKRLEEVEKETKRRLLL